MTLQSFLRRAAVVPADALRRAMASALSAERPTSPESFARFYQRVVSQLDRPVDVARRTNEGSRQGGFRAA